MKVNGLQLMQAIERLRKRIPALRNQASDSLFSFEGQEKVPVTEAVQKFEEAECLLAELQEAQSFYNRAVTFSFQGREVTLKHAITLLGPLGRTAKLWRSMAEETGRDRWSGREVSRNKDTEYATRNMTTDECIARADDADRRRSELNMQVSAANTTQIDIGNDDNEALKVELVT